MRLDIMQLVCFTPQLACIGSSSPGHTRQHTMVAQKRENFDGPPGFAVGGGFQGLSLCPLSALFDPSSWSSNPTQTYLTTPQGNTLTMSDTAPNGDIGHGGRNSQRRRTSSRSPPLDVPAAVAVAVAVAVNEGVLTEDHRPSTSTAVEVENHPTNATQCPGKVTFVSCARKRGIGCGTASCLCKNPPKENKKENGTIPGTIAGGINVHRHLGTMPETTVTAVVVHLVNGVKYPPPATCVSCATNSATGCPTAPILSPTNLFRTTCATSANK